MKEESENSSVSLQQDERSNEDKATDTAGDGGMSDQPDAGEENALEKAFQMDVEDAISVDQSKTEVATSGDKADDMERKNDSDRGGVVPPWIGFPPWGVAAVGTGELRFRKCHGEYGYRYRGVYGIKRLTAPSKTFESIQMIQRFSQQQT